MEFYSLAGRMALRTRLRRLAEDIGQTHPAVSQVVREMIKANVVEANKCPEDARVNGVSLTARGQEIGQRLSSQCADVNVAVNEIAEVSLSLEIPDRTAREPVLPAVL
jgi:DNA-binding MarR family transcriptional regulator